MNALANLIAKPARPMLRTAVRNFASAPHGAYTGGANFKKTWLSDASCYPIMAIMSTAVTGCVSFTAYKTFFCPDAKFEKARRQTLFRN